MAITRFNAKNGLSVGTGSINVIDNEGNATFASSALVGVSSSTDKLAVFGTTSLTGSVFPGITSTYNLGSASKFWSTVFANNLTGSLTRLSDGSSYLVAGAGISIVTGSNGSVTITNDGTVGDITAVNAGTGLTGGGTSGAVTLNINDSVVATVSGTTFTGAVKFNAGLSGSHTQLTDGTSYLIAGTNIGITTGSSGAVTISNTAPRFYQWNELSPSPALNTTASISIAGALGSAYNVTSVGSDVYFFVSGSTSSTYGASVFGGDLVVSGTLEAHTITNFSTNNTTSALTLNGSTRGSTATGKGVAVTAAVGTTSVGGGTVTLTAGNSGGASSNAGGITLSAGSSSSSAAAGDISISAGDTSSTTAGTRGGNITLAAGSIPSGGTGTAGNVSITTGAQANVGGTPGNITLTAQRSKIIMRRSTATAPAGTDVFLYVTGTIGDTDKSVFAGDMVVSGTVRSFTGFSGSLTRLTDGSSYLIAGSNIAITTGSNGAVTVATTGLAPSTSAFLTVGNDATLTNERSLTAGTGLTATDGGANSAYTFAINDSVVATVSGTTFTGLVRLNAGISGSLTSSNVTAGQVVVAGTAGVLSGSNNFWWDNTNGRVGIGTNTPTGILQVSGGTAAASTNGTNITIQAQSGGSGTSIGGNILLLPGTGAGGGGSHGAVGLGTASPGVWGSSGGTQSYVLQIGINGRTSLGDFSNDLQLTNNALFPNSGVWQRIGAAAASNYYQTGGTHGWRVAASSTAGSNISWTTAMLIDNSGNVGIGTASPTSRLEIVSSSTGDNANILTLRNSAYNVGESASLLFAHGGAPTSRISSYLPGSNQTNLTFHTSDTSSVLQQRMTIDGFGNVGIGTATPASRLTIQAAEGEGIVLQRPGSSPTHLKISTTAGGISPNYTTTYDTINTEMVFASATSGGTGGNIIFSTNTSGTATERLRITPSGNIGIGTSTTSDKLAVNGSLSVTGSTLPGASNTYNLGSSSKLWSTVYATSLTGSLTKLSDGTSAFIAGTNVTITTGSNGSVTISSTGGGGSGTPGGSDTQVQFNDGGSFGGDPDFTFTKASNLLRVANISGSITASNVSAGQVVVAGTGGVLSGSNNFWWDNSNGRVGIGTASPTSRLEIVSSSTGDNANILTLRNSGYSVGESASLLFAHGGVPTSRISSYLPGSNQTNLTFHTSDTSLVLQQRMTIDGSGNVGIGTSSYTSRFHVQGSSTASTPTMIVREGVASPTGGAGVFDVQNSAGTSILFVSGSRSVGIGTNSPASQLHVFNSSTSLNALVETTSALSNSGFCLRHPSNDGNFINRGDLSLFLFDATAWPILIRTLAAQPVSIHTNGTERLRVTSGGNVGIGGTNPTSRLEVTGSTGDSSAAALHLVNSSGASILYARNDQYVGIGTSTLTSGRSITTAADIEVYGVRIGRGPGNFVHNTVVGNNAMASGGTANLNTVMGYEALYSSGGTQDTVAIGWRAGRSYSGNYSVIVGTQALYASSGNYHVAIGENALLHATTGNYNVAVGFSSLQGASGQSSAGSNTAIGYASGYSITTGGQNVMGGYAAGYYTSVGASNVHLGYQAGYNNTSGSQQVSIGLQAGYSYTTQNDGVSIGRQAALNQTGATNVAVGGAALLGVSGQSNASLNVAIGHLSGYSVTTGGNNFFGGAQSGYNVSVATNNVLLGYQAGYEITSGSNNVTLGYQSGDTITTGANNIIIGSGADVAAAANTNSIVIGQGAVGIGSNTTVIGNASTTTTYLAGNVGVGTTTLLARFHVSGSSTVTDQTVLIRAGAPNQTGPVLEVENNVGSTLFVVSGSTAGNVGIGTGVPSSKFEVVGVSGSLFSVTDNLSGSLFSVNTISGLPILEVFSDNTLVAGTFNTNAFVVTGSNVGIGTSRPDARLVVSGSTILSGTLNPALDNAYSMGSTTRRWSSVVSTAFSGSHTRLTDGTSYLIAGTNVTITTGSNGSVTISSAAGTSSSATTGQVVVAGAANALSGSNDFWWDNTNRRIGIGTSTVDARLQVIGSSAVTPTMIVREGVASPTGGVRAFEVQKSNSTAIFSVSGSGNVGIGTTSPAGSLEVVGVSGSLFLVTDSLTGSLFSVNDVTGLPILEVFSDDTVIGGTVNTNALVVTGSNVGIGTRRPTGRLNVWTSFYYGGNSTGRPSAGSGNYLVVDTTTGLVREVSSTRRTKENIKPYASGLNTILALNPVNFNFIGDPVLCAGFIAEDFSDLGLEEFVLRDSVGHPVSIRYPDMVALLTNGIKELKSENDSLRSDVDALKTENEQIKSDLDALESQVAVILSTLNSGG